ncbi:hypothetical protein RAS1_02710 [Phycisphaerae bacterium RAS1]|nr:hypothetical protein RAS1_02710 [Phycisphaerae bacterium RAS1]
MNAAVHGHVQLSRRVARGTVAMALCGAACAAAEKPAVLQAAESVGDSISTARISYSHWIRELDSDEPPHTEFFLYQCAGDRFITRILGDEEGVVLRGRDGRPATQYSFIGPRHVLSDKSGIWIHAEGDPGATVSSVQGRHSESGRVLDLRSFSATPNARGTMDNLRMAAGLPPATYTTSTDGELDVVETTNEGWTIKWWIDRTRDFNVVKSQTLREGQLLGEVRYQVERIDGIWFPTRVERFRLDSGGDRPIEVLQIHKAEFNRSNQPPALTPADIGVEVGTDVQFNDRPQEDGYWDGEKVIPVDQFFRKLHSGELVRGPGVQAAMERLPRLTPEILEEHRAAERAENAQPADETPTGLELPKPAAALRRQTDSEWARYTRKFIADFSLDREQCQKAWGILRDCQEQAARYLKRERLAFEKLDDAEPGAATGAPASSPAGSARAIRLREPIDKIFEAELKPRLNRLPTRAQRQRTERTRQ